MVSRYDPDDELNIWDDLDPIIQKITHTDKITPKLADKIKKLRPVYPDKDDIYEQLQDFITNWSGDVYVLPSELFSLYKNYCKENNEKCLILSGQGFGRRLSRFIDNKTITRTILNNIPYYCKSTAIKVVQEEKITGKKRIREEEDEDCEEYLEQPPKKKRRAHDLSTWTSAKEAEEFILKISMLESQVKSLSEICEQQKELITRLTAAQ